MRRGGIEQHLGAGDDKRPLQRLGLVAAGVFDQRQTGRHDIGVGFVSRRRFQDGLEHVELGTVELIERPLQLGLGLQPVLVGLIKRAGLSVESRQVEDARSVKQGGCGPVGSLFRRFQSLEGVLEYPLKVSSAVLSQQCFQRRLLLAKRGQAHGQGNIGRQAIEQR
ncbi:hypothetical protein D3C81_1584700 [compost metagenome]